MSFSEILHVLLTFLRFEHVMFINKMNYSTFMLGNIKIISRVEKIPYSRVRCTIVYFCGHDGKVGVCMGC